MKINENRLPYLLLQDSQKYIAKLSQQQLLLKSSDNSEVSLTDSVDEFLICPRDNYFNFLILKEDKVWNGELQDLTNPQTSLQFTPLFQKGYENLSLGTFVSNSKHSPANTLLFCTSKDQDTTKLLYWEKKDKWTGPINIASGQDIILTNSSCQIDEKGNAHLVYVIKNGHQELLLQRQLSQNRKWSNPIVITQNNVSESLHEPVLLNYDNKLITFWIGDRGAKKQLYYTETSKDNYFNWNEPNCIKQVQGNNTLVYLTPGCSNKELWVVYKTSTYREGYIKKASDGEWQQINIPKNLKEIRSCQLIENNCSQRALANLYEDELWKPGMENGYNSQERDSNYQPKQKKLSQSSLNFARNKKDVQHSEKNNYNTKTRQSKTSWYGGPSPKNPRKMLTETLKSKGYSKQISNMEKTNRPNSQTPNKELKKLSKQLHSLQKEKQILADNYDKLNQKLETIEAEKEELINKINGLEEQLNNIQEENNNKKSLWSKLFR
ncbi:hypothetical protein [Natranaerobius thermophilus]|uniref:Uncharacterized protein n=1 Tax=Natranaerobius thermophilus (strain ATCC BAA-1301 / DSM 18059 / JW/NM-WN-LF) TaxID=457570 RepID=B2A4M3_NATTJ|nr:hypothetical protein [Natranaerobius thermophilus]ACB85198.1 hypothetical protein Nther_1624 [Natranaerobius thermophilus JW/NM-WN-LF]